MNTIKSSVKSAILNVLSGFSTFAHNTIITTVKLNKKILSIIGNAFREAATKKNGQAEANKTKVKEYESFS